MRRPRGVRDTQSLKSQEGKRQPAWPVSFACRTSCWLQLPSGRQDLCHSPRHLSSKTARTLVAPTVTFHQRIVFITIYPSKHFPANYGSGNIYSLHPQNTILSKKKKKRQFNFKHHFLKIALISKVLLQFQVLFS